MRACVHECAETDVSGCVCLCTHACVGVLACTPSSTHTPTLRGSAPWPPSPREESACRGQSPALRAPSGQRGRDGRARVAVGVTVLPSHVTFLEVTPCHACCVKPDPYFLYCVFRFMEFPILCCLYEQNDEP